MKKILVIALLALATTGAFAQRVDYGLDLAYLADNRQYGASQEVFSPSAFFHAVNFSPRVGMTFSTTAGVTHSVMFGADFYKNLGTGFKTWDLMQEFLYYYRFDLRIGRRGTFTGIAGCYPKSLLGSDYPLVFFSEEPRFADRNFEGFAFKYFSRDFNANVALDYFSVPTADSRERYEVLSAGDWRVIPGLSLGWRFLHMHYGASKNIPNKVNTFMFYPYAKYEPRTSLQRLSATLGWVQTRQSDTAQEGVLYPGGVLANVTVGHWGLGLSNDFYTGRDLMPYYGTSYKGVKYGSDLYPGSPFYHTHIEGFSFYDRVEIFYEPKLGNWGSVRLSAVCHLGNPTGMFGVIRGWQETVSFRINIESFRSLKK